MYKEAVKDFSRVIEIDP